MGGLSSIIVNRIVIDYLIEIPSIITRMTIIKEPFFFFYSFINFIFYFILFQFISLFNAKNAVVPSIRPFFFHPHSFPV